MLLSCTFYNSHSGPSAVKSCFEKGATKEDDNMINSIMIIDNQNQPLHFLLGCIDI